MFILLTALWLLPNCCSSEKFIRTFFLSNIKFNEQPCQHWSCSFSFLGKFSHPTTSSTTQLNSFFSELLQFEFQLLRTLHQSTNRGASSKKLKLLNGKFSEWFFHYNLCRASTVQLFKSSLRLSGISTVVKSKAMECRQSLLSNYFVYRPKRKMNGSIIGWSGTMNNAADFSSSCSSQN